MLPEAGADEHDVGARAEQGHDEPVARVRPLITDEDGPSLTDATIPSIEPTKFGRHPVGEPQARAVGPGEPVG